MKPQYSTVQRQSTRLGVTVLEVLFATMVAVVGLIGIASVIPIAARNAQEASSHSDALSLGLSWADSFIARGLHRPAPQVSRGQLSWLWYRDYDPVGNVGHGWENFVRGGYLNPFDRYRVNGVSIPDLPPEHPLNYESPSFSDSPNSSGDSHRRSWGHLAVCIDPYFMTSESMSSRVISMTTRVGAYRASVFPYFNDRYDPAVDPFAAPTLTVDQPRMLRVGLAYGQLTAPPYERGRLVSRNVVSTIMSSVDDLTVDDSAETQTTDVDRQSRPSSRFFSRAANGSALKTLVDGRYTWMATVVPFEPEAADLNSFTKSDMYITSAEKNCLVSFVVLDRHSHEYIPAAANPVPGDAESQPTGERMVRVYPMSGNFEGGTGGRVRLIANETVSSKLRVGDWIVLGRYYLFDTTDGSRPRRPYPFFRWYRIIGTSGEPDYGTLGALRPPQYQYAGDPVDEPVWARDVVLEGPDFAFYEMNIASTPIPTPTFGTLVSGVVTVIERQVTLE